MSQPLDTVDEYVRKARHFFLSADFAACIDTLSAGIVAFPTAHELYFELGSKLRLRVPSEKNSEGIETLKQAITALEAAYALAPRLDYANRLADLLIEAGRAKDAMKITQRISTSIARWVTEGQLVPKPDRKVRDLHQHLFSAEFEKGYKAEVSGKEAEGAKHMLRAVMLQLGGFNPVGGPLETYAHWELK